MNTRFAMFFIALLLTFIFVPVAEAKFAPHAAPGTFSSVITENDSSFPIPFEELESHEHHDHEVIAESAVPALATPKSGFAVLAPGFAPQSVYIVFRHPPRT